MDIGNDKKVDFNSLYLQDVEVLANNKIVLNDDILQKTASYYNITV